MAGDDTLPSSSSSPLPCDSANPCGHQHLPLALYSPAFTIIIVLLLFFLVHFFRDDLRDDLRRRFIRFRATLSSLSSPPKVLQGLDGTILKSFSVFLYRKEIVKVQADCPVCLADFEEGDEVRLLTACYHAFHAGCVDRWLSEHTTCPVCRSDLTVPPDATAVLTANEVVDGHIIAVTEITDTKMDTNKETDSLLEWMDVEQRPLQRGWS